MASKFSKAKSSPSPDKHITKKGQAEHSVTVPGYDHACGTPSWASKPAKAAERKAK